MPMLSNSSFYSYAISPENSSPNRTPTPRCIHCERNDPDSFLKEVQPGRYAHGQCQWVANTTFDILGKQIRREKQQADSELLELKESLSNLSRRIRLLEIRMCTRIIAQVAIQIIKRKHGLEQ